MLRNGKSIGALLLAGLAVFAYYKYSRMNEDQKSDLKQKGKKLVDRFTPKNLKNGFLKTGQTNNNFAETNTYNS